MIQIQELPDFKSFVKVQNYEGIFTLEQDA